MQITKAEVTPVELKLKYPVRMAGIPPIEVSHWGFCPFGDSRREKCLGLWGRSPPYDRPKPR